MQVAQRGTSVTSVAHDDYTLDRWFQWASSGSESGRSTVTKQSASGVANGISSSMKIAVTTAQTSVGSTDAFAIMQRLEAQDILQLGIGTSVAKDLTLSFYARASGSFTLCAGISTNGGGKYSKENSITTSWQRFTVTIPATTSASHDCTATGTSIGLQVFIALMMGGDRNNATNETWDTDLNGMGTANQSNFYSSTSNWLEITGVQLEVGSVATPFEHRSYGEELARCKRYYQQWGGNTGSERVMTGFYNSSNQLRICLPLHPNMRTTPSIGVSAHSHWKVEVSGSSSNTAHSLDQASPRVASINVTTNHTRSAGDCGQLIANDDGTNNSRLYLDAEL